MNYFTEIPDAHAVTVSSGVYRQVRLYERGGKLYARHGAGFVKLHQGGTTSHTNTRWLEIDPGDWISRETKGMVLVYQPDAIAAQ